MSRNAIRMIAGAAGIVVAAIAVSHSIERYASTRPAALLSLKAFVVQQQVAATLEVKVRSVVQVGDVVAVPLVLDVTDARMNAIEGTISYSANDLDVVRISTSDSILNVWIHQPSVSATGTIRFAGGVLPPGFTGSDGNILTMLFKAKKRGTTRIGISRARLLAHDGLGSEIPLDFKPLDLVIIDRRVKLVGDLDGDGAVGFPDLLKVVASWGREGTEADLDADGAVNVKDVRVLLAHWSSSE